MDLRDVLSIPPYQSHLTCIGKHQKKGASVRRPLLQQYLMTKGVKLKCSLSAKKILTKQENRVIDFTFLQSVDDKAGEGSDIGSTMTSDLGLVPNSS